MKWSQRWISSLLKTHGQNSNHTTENESTDSHSSESDTSSNTNTVSPEMLQNLMKMFMNSSYTEESQNESEIHGQSNPSIDMNTILKMKSIMEKMR